MTDAHKAQRLQGVEANVAVWLVHEVHEGVKHLSNGVKRPSEEWLAGFQLGALRILLTIPLIIYDEEPRSARQDVMTVRSCCRISFTASSSSWARKVSLGCSIKGTTSSKVRATTPIML
ncbi:hypothetical protein E2C01_040831 [Portunus trituberculatus]|uniref:Uncharacterized protein n=1 Tax=Portunus trituberculatus TaxID=210409 RepID=A0A5B7FNR0_PORTR|nr:hypothetical protein [Portunus trituberculatus]